MDELHAVGVSEESRSSIEAVGSEFIKDGILNARKKSWECLQAFRTQIREGMTEDEARKLALVFLADAGVKKNWHRPYIRFASGTTLSFHDPIQVNYRLKAGDAYYLDFGPVWTDEATGIEYEGDVGDTFVFGDPNDNIPAHQCAETARELFALAHRKWKNESLSGKEIYQYLKKAAEDKGYLLLERVDGHRMADFPHHRYSKERMAHLEFHPSQFLWALEVQIIHPTHQIGAFFEDLLI